MIPPARYYPDIVPLDRLRSSDWNPRLVFTDDFGLLKKSIRADPDLLLLRPVLAQADGTIYAGNMRYQAVRSLLDEGWTPPWGDGIPAVIQDVDDLTAKARAVRDNNHAGNDQEEALAELLLELQQGEARLNETTRALGLRDSELLNILATVGEATPVNPLTGERADPEDIAVKIAVKEASEDRRTGPKPSQPDSTPTETENEPRIDATEQSDAFYALRVLGNHGQAERDALAITLVDRGFAVQLIALEAAPGGGVREVVAEDEAVLELLAHACPSCRHPYHEYDCSVTLGDTPPCSCTRLQVERTQRLRSDGEGGA